MVGIWTPASLRTRRSSGSPGWGGTRIHAAGFGKGRRRAEQCRRTKRAALPEQHAKFGFADARRVLQHGLEHRLQLAGRTADDLSTSAVAVCCCSDSRSSLSRRVFSMAIDGLGGEIFDQLDLLVGERPDFVPINVDDTNEFRFPQHRNADDRSRTSAIGERDNGLVALAIGCCGAKVREMRSLLGSCRDRMGLSGCGRRSRSRNMLSTCRRRVSDRNIPKSVALAKRQIAKLRLADARRVLQQRLEHGYQLARRAADDLQHLRGRGLLLQRFAQLVEQAGVLDGDDGLGGEVL